MLLKPLARFKVADRVALALNVATLSRRLIENTIGGLDQTARLELPQKIARADQIGALIDDGAPALDVGIFEKQKRASLRVRAQKSVQRLDRGLLAKAANRTAFVQAALLVDADVGRNDTDPVEMFVDPRDDPVDSWRAAHSRRLDIDRVRNANRQTGAQQHVKRVREHEGDQRRLSVTTRR